MPANLNGAVQDAAKRIEGLMEPQGQPEDKPEETTEVEAQAETEETSEATTEENTEEVTEETEAEAEPEGETEAEAADGETDETTTELPESLNDLAAQMSLEADDLLNLTLTTKVNGEERAVTLRDLRSGHMMEADYRQKTAELSEQRKQSETEIESQQAQWSQRLQDVDAMSTALETQLNADYQNIDWNTLRTEDPGEYAARQAEFQQRSNSIQQVKSKARNEYEKAKTEHQDKREKEQKAYLSSQHDLLVSRVPEWGKPETRTQLNNDISAYLKTEGFNDQQVSGIADHRYLILAQKAMLYDKMHSKKPGVKKVIKKAPKMIKSGAKQSKADINSQETTVKRNRLRKSGTVKDAANLLETFM